MLVKNVSNFAFYEVPKNDGNFHDLYHIKLHENILADIKLTTEYLSLCLTTIITHEYLRNSTNICMTINKRNVNYKKSTSSYS